MIDLPALLGALMPLSLAVCILILARLSKRLGAVTHTAPGYRWLYLSAVLTASGTLIRLLAIDQPALTESLAIADNLVLGLGLLLSIVVAWRYWGWMLSERGD